MIKKDAFLSGDLEYIEQAVADVIAKAWSDEARAAAAEARRNNAMSRTHGEGGPTETTRNPFQSEDFTTDHHEAREHFVGQLEQRGLSRQTGHDAWNRMSDEDRKGYADAHAASRAA